MAVNLGIPGHFQMSFFCAEVRIVEGPERMRNSNVLAEVVLLADNHSDNHFCNAFSVNKDLPQKYL